MANFLQTNLSSITSGASAAASLGGILFVSPSIGNTRGYQPLNPSSEQGLFDKVRAFFNNDLPPTLMFHYEGEQTITLESDITNHYSEKNSSVQDQIALKPEIITAKGYIGELNNVLPAPLQALQTVANTLVSIPGYEPQLSTTALIQLNQAILQYENAASIANSAVSVWSSISNAIFDNDNEVSEGSGVFTQGTDLAQNKQQEMFQQLYGYWFNRILFNVQTPWAIFTDMAILSLKAIQNEDTRVITDFELTFQKIRTASTQLFDFSGQSIGRAATQSASAVNLGTSSGAGNTSMGSSISGVLAA